MCKGDKGKSSIFWETGNPPPSDLKNPFLSTLVPRTLAWFAIDDKNVSLLDGYTAACFSPPTIIFAAGAIPPEAVTKLKETKVCTLSVATVREPEQAYSMAAYKPAESPESFSFDQLGLKSSKTKSGYPPIVLSSPIQMHCNLRELIDMDNGEGMTILTVESFVIDGSVLSPPTEDMKEKRPGLVAKIDAELIKPVVSLGEGRFSPLAALKSMDRPTKKDDGSWHSDDFDPRTPSVGKGKYETVEWCFRKDGSSSPLGYNAVTALIMPRPIGWISTYRKEGKIPHLAPYSFFTDVSRGEQPMIAFSGNRRNGKIKKDAQQDSEDMGCFAYNMVSEELAVAMNYSAAEMEREESEFELAKLDETKAKLIDAPVVKDARIKYECEYVKTVDVSNFSIVVGKVKGIEIDADVIADGVIDPAKLKPVLRLGFTDEYGVLPR